MFNIQRSKSGIPTLTENGGGETNTGSAQVIAGPRGEKVKPLFIPRGYSNQDHAIFVLKVGMIVVKAWHDRNGEGASAYKITKIGTPTDPDAVESEKIAEYENGDGNFPDWLEAARQAALKKSHSYHCRSPFYIGE